ncbi:uncharacterized protein LOC105646039 isoform X2 [Jatropha curcas]|uniref:uncharacterized protein LOC105646039 isoform X2 n=1 Tax=Jatropha curcas TaxID=180498 RepID=UPI0009D773A4|nr:uncharacterized protein LOC105646039 isoform X2 [Jatropha curcas]
MGSDSERKSKINNNENRLQIPPATEKMIQSIREIIDDNCTDTEIYSVLKECDMDPNDAVQRLLSQDIFHEVKSKRERRKEMKETQESKARCSSNGYRGVKGCAEYNVGRSSSQISYNDLGKAAYVRENLSIPPAVTSSSSLTYHMRTVNEQLSPHSPDNGRETLGTANTIFSSEPTSLAPQAAFGGGPSGHASMADIVKMSCQHNMASNIVMETSYTLQDTDAQDSFHSNLKPSSNSSTLQEMQELQSPHPAEVSITIHQSGIIASRHDLDDEWPVIEQRMSMSGSSILNISSTPGLGTFPNHSHLFGDETKLSNNIHSENVRVSEMDVASKNLGSNCVEPESPSSRQENANHVGGASFNDMISYDLHRCMNELHEGRESGSHLPFANCSAPLNDEVTSTAVTLQQLSLEKETKVVPLAEDNCGVVFPTDMQAFAADCSHLSFGTYKSGVPATAFGPLESNPLKSNLEASGMNDVISSVSLAPRNSGYLGDSLCNEQVASMSDSHQLTANIRKLEFPVSSQIELMKQNILQVNGGHDYSSPKSIPDSCFKNIQEHNSSLSVVINPHARNLPPLHRQLQASSMSVPVDLLASAVQSVKDSNHVLSPSVGTQSLASNYNDIISTAAGSTIPITEVLNSVAFSSPMLHSSALPTSSLTSGHVVPQHLPAHSYSQSPLSLEELLNWNAYSAVPQTYSGIPSALQQQQAYQDSSAFLDPLAGMRYNLQQLRGVASRSSIPLSHANVSSYGGLGNSTNFSGSFLNDPSATINRSVVGYNDLLRSQYKEGNNFTMLHQNHSLSSWDYEPGSRPLSTVPNNGYYNFQGGQPPMYQQGQLLSQNYGAPVFHSQQRILREEQQQNLGDLPLSSSQGPSKQVRQLWHHTN